MEVVTRVEVVERRPDGADQPTSRRSSWSGAAAQRRDVERRPVGTAVCQPCERLDNDELGGPDRRRRPAHEILEEPALSTVDPCAGYERLDPRPAPGDYACARSLRADSHAGMTATQVARDGFHAASTSAATRAAPVPVEEGAVYSWRPGSVVRTSSVPPLAGAVRERRRGESRRARRGRSSGRSTVRALRSRPGRGSRAACPRPLRARRSG